MKVLIIDRDRMATQFLRSKIETAGHEIFEEAVKNNAIEVLRNNKIDLVLFDPAPLNDARPLVLGIRRTMQSYGYVTMMSHNQTRKDAIRTGCNDILTKPLDASDLDVRLENAKRLNELVEYMGDASIDFPSAGGIIAKSAFNQLFRSSIDRADRYGEQSYMMIIKLDNYGEIMQVDGAYAAEYAISKLAQQLTRMRRQSDIISQIGENQYVLLLQRPNDDNEPMEAAKRFAQTLEEQEDAVANGTLAPQASIQLLDLPVGNLLFEHKLAGKGQTMQSSG